MFAKNIALCIVGFVFSVNLAFGSNVSLKASNNLEKNTVEREDTNNTNIKGSICNNIPDVYNRISQSVLQIKSFKINDMVINGNNGNYYSYKKSMELYSVGSGFVISEDGYILTNNHVIDGADEIMVYLKNIEYKAELIGSDFYQDVALLKINSRAKLTPLTLKEDIKYNVGEEIIAVGNPYGLGISVSSGIISAVNRSISEIDMNNLIQIDAIINRGNSGGPLFNCNGEVIGMNTILYFNNINKNNTTLDVNGNKNNNDFGVGFAIPADVIMSIVDKIKEVGYIQKGWIGIKGQNIKSDILKIINSKKQSGVMVIDITSGSPANNAGILIGDVIISYNNTNIVDNNQLLHLIKNTDVDSTADVLVLRNGRYLRIKVKVADSPEINKYNEVDESIKTNSIEFMDIILTKIDENLVEKYKIYNNKYGMYVLKVKEKSIANYYGIEAGDVVLNVNQFSTNTKEDFLSAINNIKLSGKKEFFMILKKKNDKKNILLKLNTNLIE